MEPREDLSNGRLRIYTINACMKPGSIQCEAASIWNMGLCIKPGSKELNTMNGGREKERGRREFVPFIDSLSVSIYCRQYNI